MAYFFKKIKNLRAQVAVIKIFGEISETNPVIEHAFYTLNTLYENPPNELILYISGTGGAISVAQEMTMEVLKFSKKTSCRVSVYIGESAFSASLYLALVANQIYCQPGAMLGSVGAIIKHKSFEGLYSKLGIVQEVITSALQKDLLSNSRSISSAENESLKCAVDNVHEQFIEWIEHRRNIDMHLNSEYFDGRIFTGKIAKAIGLVDHFGTISDIVNNLQISCNFNEAPEIIFYEPKNITTSPLSSMLSGLSLSSLKSI